MTSPHESAHAAQGLTIAYESPGCVIASFHNVCMVVWGSPVTPAIIEELDAVGVALESRYERTSCIHVVSSQVPLPDGAGREALNNSTKRAAPKLICAAAVLMGEGFWASAMRGLLTSLVWVGRSTFKTHICGSIREACEWVPPLHGAVSVKLNAQELEAAVVALCARPSVSRAVAKTG